ncbi:MAG: hypothetical protein SV966_11735, partial [Actinomycetota bacterium]|nr:hypothetical protein [Actinomycetota bacterium]
EPLGANLHYQPAHGDRRMNGHRDSRSARGIPAVHCGEDVNNNDTVGADNAVERLATGLGLAKSSDVLDVAGTVDAAVRERAYQLGGTLAAMLME